MNVLDRKESHKVVEYEVASGLQQQPLSTTTGTNTSTWAVLLLNMVAILWGTQHAVIKSVVSDQNAAAVFTLARFGLATLFALPYTPLPTQNQTDSSSTHSLTTTWRWGAEMGLWMFLGFSFQAIGLEYTTAQKSGFLLYLNVKFVPFLAKILLQREISLATWASALTAFTGTALLALGGDGTSNNFDSNTYMSDLNIGDLWSVAAAVASAMFILRLEKASAVVPSAAQLNAACLWVVTLLAGIWTLASATISNGDAPILILDELVGIFTQHPWELLYLSAVTTTAANWIQTKAQRGISAERASVIYAMDPVYGAVFAYWFLGETLGGVQGWIGAGMITVAAATNAFLDFNNTNNKVGRKDL